MKTQLRNRLKELQSGFESGQRMLADLEAKRENLSRTLLRISGAMQVLQEEIAKVDDSRDQATVLSEENKEQLGVTRAT